MPTPTAGRAPSPQGQTLLSRLKPPFAPKTLRNVSEFFIQPDDPHRQYGPGDVITGSVILKVVKPLRLTHLVVCLHGFVQVFKTPNNPGEGYRTYCASLAAGKTKKSGGYYGNGFASLFEDEVVLCGDGRLGEGSYQFNFELEFPCERLPSSIDFERGTISYMISSTLTRPTTIAPTMTCDRKVSYQEDMDVASLFQPKPRVISLEPISRRRKSKHRARRKTESANGQSQGEDATSVDTVVDGRTTISRTNSIDAEPPQSPSPSDMSFDSCHSSCGTGSAADSNPPSVRTGDSKIGKTRISPATKPVTATIELQKAGFLRGDLIPIKIHVHHTKHIKSLHGVIVTLYRQARVDVNPALPKVGSGKTDPDTISKSRTGIGLSITGAGSSHLFRKDLSQSFASLIINPSTLSAEIKATVRVPEEAFPTISTAPGAMITFKYYVEVVLDLQGKLAGLDRFLPNAGMAGISSHTGDSAVGSPADANNSVFAAWGGHFMDTEEIRRDKSVVSCIFEIIIGTRDSERKGKWKQLNPTDGSTSNGDGPQPTEVQSNQASNVNNVLGREDESTRKNGQHVPLVNSNGGSVDVLDNTNAGGRPAPIVPIPDVGAEEAALSEKERLRRAEERLLPSRPPEDGASASNSALHAPSAPVLPDERLPGFSQDAPVYSGPSTLPVPAASSATAPAYEPHVPFLPQLPTAATDDKHELQRRHLEAERSAPDDLPGDDDDDDAAGPSAPPADAFVPSAPTFEDVDDFDFAMPGEHSLPKYER